MRLDKLLSHAGYGTRKEVKSLLKQGILVNGKIVKSGKVHVDPDKDVIEVDGEILEYSEYVYYMLNKPSGYLCASHDIRYPVVVDLIEDVHELFCVGRLDLDTEGLLLVTNDGGFAHHLTSPVHHVPKTYYARVTGKVEESDKIIFSSPMDLGDFKAAPSQLEILESNEEESICLLTIYEGKFHQVKRMFEKIGHTVIYLKRISIGNVELDENLNIGEYRLLSKDEIDRLSGYDML